MPSEKIFELLLSRRTLKSFGRHKLFTAYGLHPDDPRRLVDAIHRHPENGIVIPLPADDFGKCWNVVGPILTPDGRHPIIRTGWIKDRSGPARFVTVLPEAE